MKTQPSSWHISIQVVCLVLVWICYVNGQRQCSCRSYSENSGNCRTCDDECFLSNHMCYKCPDNCMTCSSTSYCGQCQTEFYGTACEHSCSSCKNGQCSKTNCISGCADGYYPKQGGAVCTACTAGYYGSNCQYLCSYCKDRACYKVNGHCIYGCSDGYYLSQGVCYNCPLNCTSCSSSLYCTGCKFGNFGSFCQNICKHCKNNSCYKDNGQCTHGCVDGYYQPQSGGDCVVCPNQCLRCNSETYCTLCNKGYYGPQSCRSICDPKCKYGFCNSANGICTNGCVEGYYQNDNTCLLNCQIDFCQTCRSDNQFCSVCKDGYFILNGMCSQCRSVCLNGKCEKTDGSCSEGCKDGFTGRYCNDQCYLNCIACEQYNKEICSLCKPGYYGQKCEFECTTQCKEVNGERSCAKTNGKCTYECEDGYKGSTCAERCSLNCLSCDRNKQRSCDTCNPGYYGQVCNERCSSHCGEVNNTRPCHKDTGECLVNCTKGYRGLKCDVPCKAGCHNGCDRDKGACDRCKTLYYGPSCEFTCNSTCYNPNNGSSVCDKQTGNCSFECSASQCGVQSGQESAAKFNNKGTIIGAATGFVIVVLIVVVVVIVFIGMRRKRQKTSNPEPDGLKGGNTDNMYSMLDHAYQDKMADYTALNALAGQLQEGQAIPSPPTDAQKATYVNTDDISTGPAKDSYENVIGLRK